MRTLMADVSEWQGKIDFAKMRAAGIDDVYIRVLDLAGGPIDDRFRENWIASSFVAGLRRGAYVYWRPNYSTQAQYDALMVAFVGLDGGELPLAVDVEESGGLSMTTVAARLRSFLSLIENGNGRRPIIYTSASKWGAIVGNPSWARAYRYFVAHYYTPIAVPNLPLPCSRLYAWQFSSTGDGPKYGASSKYIDLSWLYGDDA